MISLIILPVARRWGLIIIGGLLIIGGLIYGASSHQVSYQSVSEGSVAHFLVGDSTGYLEMSGSSALYVVNENDFTPTIDGTNTFGNGDNISFVYRTDETTDIDQTSTIGTHLVGSGYTIVELTVFSDSGQKVFKTTDYAQNPNGFEQNNWLAGGALAFVGLIIVGLAFVLPARRKKNIVQPEYNPAMIGMPGQPNPYQQPYQQPYQAPGQYNQYPSQPNQYNPPYNQQYGQAQPGQYEPTQVANPYNQPPRQ
jgi:hypothetical protein